MPPVPYHHGKFPPKNIDLARLVPLIGPATAALARYDGVLHGVQDTRVLLSPLTSQEAVLSSRIEGTQATLGEVLEFEVEEDSATGEKRFDIMEVLNYRRALHTAIAQLDELPLSQRLIRNAHKVLLDGVRGENKTPGEYRRTQNIIGAPGDTVETARFVPPGPGRVTDLMGRWETYIHEPAPDKLIQLSVMHAEFEAIHPFLDGNGRVGRLLIPLYLVKQELLSSPSFFISDYLEAKREEYCDRLLRVSRNDDWTGWCEFFLKALKAQAEDNEQKAKAILELYNQRKDWIVDETHSQYAVRALDWFFAQPVFRPPRFASSAGIPEATANRIVRLARDGGMLIEVRAASGRRAAVLAFGELLDIAETRSSWD